MKEFLTHKSGKFYFTGDYDSEKLDPLLIRASILNETIKDLPILPDLASQIDSDIIYSSISGTAAIEGNPISKEGVKNLAEGKDDASYTKKHKQEILNLIEAYKLFNYNSTKESFVISEDLICNIHNVITKNIPDEKNSPGQYRNHLVYVGHTSHGGIYKPPKILKDIQDLMSFFVDWINSEEVTGLDPFIRAFLAHYYLCIIHPFGDGNGRTARLLEGIILQTAGNKYLPRQLSNYYYLNIDDYYIEISKSLKNKNDNTPFLAFCAEGAVKSLKFIKSRIIFYIRKLTLKDFYGFERENKRLTARQYELLILLLDNTEYLTLKDLQTKSPFSLLYSKVTTQTARRDLSKLYHRGFLDKDDYGKYFLNIKILD